MQTLFEERILKASRDEEAALYALASPMDQIHPEAPPFLVIHGDCDSLAPVTEARRFVEDLRAGSNAPVAYAELAGAQHAVDIFPSLRTEHALTGVECFLAVVYSDWLAARDAERRSIDSLPVGPGAPV